MQLLFVESFTLKINLPNCAAGMGLTASTSLSKLGENAALKKFVGVTPIPEGDSFWKELLTFSYVPSKSM